MTFGEIYREMADYMKELMLIEEKQDEIVIRQAAGKIMDEILQHKGESLKQESRGKPPKKCIANKPPEK